VGLRLVIVDDSAEFAEAARALLEREGLTVVGVGMNSAEAIKLVDELRPDAVLVDVGLGEEDGFELARRLAALDGGISTTVILISTHPPSDFGSLVEESPAAGFVRKSDLSADMIRRIAC
jgi:CheY-like chemotaxis protein